MKKNILRLQKSQTAQKHYPATIFCTIVYEFDFKFNHLWPIMRNQMKKLASPVRIPCLFKHPFQTVPLFLWFLIHVHDNVSFLPIQGDSKEGLIYQPIQLTINLIIYIMLQ